MRKKERKEGRQREREREQVILPSASQRQIIIIGPLIAARQVQPLIFNKLQRQL